MSNQFSTLEVDTQQVNDNVRLLQDSFKQQQDQTVDKSSQNDMFTQALNACLEQAQGNKRNHHDLAVDMLSFSKNKGSKSAKHVQIMPQASVNTEQKVQDLVDYLGFGKSNNLTSKKLQNMDFTQLQSQIKEEQEQLDKYNEPELLKSRNDPKFQEQERLIQALRKSNKDFSDQIRELQYEKQQLLSNNQFLREQCQKFSNELKNSQEKLLKCKKDLYKNGNDAETHAEESQKQKQKIKTLQEHVNFVNSKVKEYNFNTFEEFINSYQNVVKQINQANLLIKRQEEDIKQNVNNRQKQLQLDTRFKKTIINTLRRQFREIQDIQIVQAKKAILNQQLLFNQRINALYQAVLKYDSIIKKEQENYAMMQKQKIIEAINDFKQYNTREQIIRLQQGHDNQSNILTMIQRISLLQTNLTRLEHNTNIVCQKYTQNINIQHNAEKILHQCRSLADQYLIQRQKCQSQVNRFKNALLGNRTKVYVLQKSISRVKTDIQNLRDQVLQANKICYQQTEQAVLPVVNRYHQSCKLLQQLHKHLICVYKMPKDSTIHQCLIKITTSNSCEK